VGAEESIKGSENHRDNKHQRVIQDSIVVDGDEKSAGKLAFIELVLSTATELACVFQARSA
jgi:hypothetical protein